METHSSSSWRAAVASVVWILRRLSPFHRECAAAVGLTLVGTAATVAIPLTVRAILNSALTKEHLVTLAPLAVALAALPACSAVVTLGNAWFPILSGRHGPRREKQGYRQWKRPGGGLCGWHGRHVRVLPTVCPGRLPVVA